MLKRFILKKKSKKKKSKDILNEKPLGYPKEAGEDGLIGVHLSASQHRYGIRPEQ